MSITQKTVFAAADKIKSNGVNPTLANVRDELGGGSFTTISPFLNEWKDKEKVNANPIKEPAPQAVLEQLQELGTELWAVAMDMANNRLASEREALDNRRIEMDQRLKEAVELADSLSAEKEQLNGLVNSLESDKKLLLQKESDQAEKVVELQGANTELTTELEKCKLQLTEKSSSLLELKKQFEESQKTLSVRNEEYASVNAELGKCQGQLVEKVELIKELKGQLNELSQLKTELGTVKGQLSEKERLLIESKNEFSTREKELKETINDISKNNVELEKVCSISNAKVDTLESSLSSVNDENLKLTKKLAEISADKS